MNFYICIDYSGCSRPEIVETSMSNSMGLSGEWFKRMIYIETPTGSDYYSIAQKNEMVWGGYVLKYQVKPLVVKRTII